MQRVLATTEKPESKTINNYKDLEGTVLPPVTLKATTKSDESPEDIILNEEPLPILLLLQPGPSTKEEAVKLKAEQARIKEQKLDEQCWMDTEGLPGCGGEIEGWNKLIFAELSTGTIPTCKVMAFSLKDSKQQQIVISEKELKNITLLSPGYLANAEALLNKKAGDLKGIRYMPRGALLIAPGGKVIKSYDLSTKSPAENPQIIFSTLADDIRKIPKPAAAVPASVSADAPTASNVAQRTP